MNDTNEAPFPSQEIIPQDTQPVTPPFPQESPGIVSQQETPLPSAPPSIPQPKKSITKFIVLGIILLLILGILIFLAIRFRQTSVSKLFGTKGEILWWGLQIEESVVAPLIEGYERQNPGIKIKYQKQSQLDYRERLTNALASGKGPDIFEIHNSWVVMFDKELFPLPDSIMTKEEFSQTFYPVIVSDLSNERGIVAVPLEYDAITLFVNEDIFASAVKSPPRTWNELRDLVNPISEGSLTLKDERGPIIQSGVALGVIQNIDHWPEILALMLLQNGVDFTKPSTNLVEDAINFYISFSRDKVWDETLPSSTTAFAREKVAMYFGPTRRASEITRLNTNIRFKTVPLPQLPKEKPTDPDYSYTTYWAEGVWEKSKNREVAWEFLKYLSSSDSLKKLNDQRVSLDLLERPYPRVDLSSLQLDDKILGSVTVLAPAAKSFYMADETFDGETGVNSQMNEVFEAIINKALDKRLSDEDFETLAQDMAKILAQYGRGK